MTLHHFDKSHAFGESAADLPFWLAAYRQGLGDSRATVFRNDQDGPPQRMGLDDMVLMSANANVVRVQRKTRSGAGTSDILLEVTHVYQDGRDSRPGWIEKDAPIEYLAYGWPAVGLAYLFPWANLRAAWKNNRERWRKAMAESFKARKPDARRGADVGGFFWVSAENASYDTHSLAVPTGVLVEAIVDTIRIQLPPRAA